MRLQKLLIVGAVSSVLSLFATGCAYRADLDQGNFVEQSAVNQLRQGMTAEQVRYILGTPMLTDPFDNTRWYYVNFKREGWGSPTIKNLVAKFEGRTLVDIGGDYKKSPAFYSGQRNVQKIDFSQISATGNTDTKAK